MPSGAHITFEYILPFGGESGIGSESEDETRRREGVTTLVDGTGKLCCVSGKINLEKNFLSNQHVTQTLALNYAPHIFFHISCKIIYDHAFLVSDYW